MEKSEFSTFKGLYNKLLELEESEFNNLLSKKYVNIEIQESILRLFSFLGLIKELEGYKYCIGNFNKLTIKESNNMKDIFINNDGSDKKLKDKGDKSDLTMYNSKENKFLITTSKNLGTYNIGKLDISDIKVIYDEYKDCGELKLCIVVNSKDKFNKCIENSEESSEYIKKIMRDYILLGHEDLQRAFIKFKEIYNKPLEKLIYNDKKILNLRFHQELCIEKSLNLIKKGEQNILWGHIPRSGKSYIMTGMIIKDSINKKRCNYLIITTAPKETIKQYLDVLDCKELSEFKIVNMNSIKKESIKLSKKNIIISSKQYLQDKIKEKKKLIKKLVMNYDITFCDESHNGGSTRLSQRVLDNYCKNSVKIQITATYLKPSISFNISDGATILWDIEDVELCKNIDRKKDRLVEKHGDIIVKLLEKYNIEELKEEYSKYPKLNILTRNITDEEREKIIRDTKENDYGWNIKNSFLLNKYNNKFQNKECVLELFNDVFGKKGYIEKIRINQKLDEGELSDPCIVMCFFFFFNIKNISDNIKSLLENEYDMKDILICITNSKMTDDPKKKIEDSVCEAVNKKKKYVLVLSGIQCSLGVSLENCDIVLLMNNSSEYDRIFQMMFRCMTERKNKRDGYVIDFNINRLIETTLASFVDILQPEKSFGEATKYILEEKLIKINVIDVGNNVKKIKKLCENIEKILNETKSRVIKNNLYRLRMKSVYLEEKDKDFLKSFKKGKRTEGIEKITLQMKDLKITDGAIESDITALEDKKENKEKKEVKKEEKKEEKKEDKLESDNITLNEFISYIIPLNCILTINIDIYDFEEMMEVINNEEELLNILLNQIRTWWDVKVNIDDLKKIIDIYNRYMSNDIEIKNIVKNIKRLFVISKTDRDLLSELIDDYMLATNLEKKQNAEVATPYELRKEMLDKIPLKFWTKKRKVFEPCSGKGGFLIDIVNRFMEGLKDKIEDEKKRYKYIVEKCLYFSDINPTNIFINKLLLDPENEYELNYNEGDTLKLDIKEKWDIEGFDAVIGNPPYNASGNTNTGHTIWQYFTYNSLKKWIIKKGYLLYVHPAGWRKPNSYMINNENLLDIMIRKNNMIYLEIHNTKDGMKKFNCGTRYDWYLIKKVNRKKKCLINDEKRRLYKIDLSNLILIPNFDIDIYMNVLGDNSYVLERCYTHSSTKKKIVKKVEDKEFKYKLIHSTTLKGINYLYTNDNKNGYFGIKKIVFGDSGINDVVIDKDGIYGVSEHGISLKYTCEKEAEEIKKALLSNKFKDFINACSWSNYQIDWRLFKHLKKDFWKEFI